MKLLSALLLIAISAFFFFGTGSAELSEDPKITSKVYFDITEGGKAIGRITIGLFGETVPITAENFRLLATSDDPTSSYKKSAFHRVIDQFMIQGGDYTLGNGRGGAAAKEISTTGKFNDENFVLKHDRKYRLSMANAGKNTNGSQFFITTVVTPWLDGKHVVFGQVIDGEDVVDYISKVKTNRANKPDLAIVIEDSGEIVEEETKPEDPVKDEL